MIKLRYKILTVLGAVGLLLGWLHFKHPVKGVTLLMGKTSEESLHLPDYGHGNVITVKKVKGKMVTIVTPKIFGIPFDIGISGALTGRETEFYLTTEVFYYRHFELLGGAGITYPIIHPRVMGALGYRLPWKRVDNLSVFVGYDLQLPIIGVYARFGSN